MELAILFWFYKEPEICINRLELIRKHNPNIKIYGLYGGDHAEEQNFKDKLSPYLNDFYISSERDPDWKWINGDLVLLEWYENRGKNLTWDSIAIIQWDMLVFDELYKQFPEIKKGEIFLSGLQELDEHTENDWDWTSPSGKERTNFENFLAYIRNKYGFTEKPLCCLFVLEVIPKAFFEKYSQVQNKLVGMLEYKIPTYAKIFNIPFYIKDKGVCWQGEPTLFPLNAIPQEIETEYITKELSKPNGWRIFHPYFKIWS